MPATIRCALLVSLIFSAAGSLAVDAAQIEHLAFTRTWQRADLPVVTGAVNRTWMWGPEASSAMLVEPYDEAPGGQRVVQYFDKSRMEITNPGGDPASIWYVTNGLLVVELITGTLQIGNNEYEQYVPAVVNVAGDPGDSDAPTYASFLNLRLSSPAPVGEVLQQQVFRDGTTSHDVAFGLYNVVAAQHVPETNHSIAAPFWEFMNSTGLVYQEGEFTTAPLFPNPYYATGYPVTEAYWANVEVGGTLRSVLMQCFERRCLTFTPENPPAWQVEAGNVGQHYYAWRYSQIGKLPVNAPTPTTGDVRIVDVVYDPPGTEGQEETLTLVNRSDTAIQLRDWRIEDASGTIYYRFPDFVLPPQGTVTVHACAGVNTPTLLFNGRCSPTWNNNGDTAILFDATGRIVHSYMYAA